MTDLRPALNEIRALERELARTTCDDEVVKRWLAHILNALNDDALLAEIDTDTLAELFELTTWAKYIGPSCPEDPENCEGLLGPVKSLREMFERLTQNP